MDFNELLIRFTSAISRRRRLFLAIFLVSFLAATAGAYVKPQWFESKSTLFVSLAAPRMNTSRSEERNVVALVQPEEFVASQVELMQTRDLIEELVDTLPPWVFRIAALSALVCAVGRQCRQLSHECDALGSGQGQTHRAAQSAL